MHCEITMAIMPR